MPELPEVETIVRELGESVAGKRISEIGFVDDRACVIGKIGCGQKLEDRYLFTSGEKGEAASGKRIDAVSGGKIHGRSECNNEGGIAVKEVLRRGKFIIFNLERGLRLVVHLRMTGRLMWHVEPGREKFVRVEIRFADGDKLYFSDVRKFGRMWIFSEEDYEKATGIYRLGLEPLKTDFKRFANKFFKDGSGRRKKGILKNSLLRQDSVAGIGNIYADEICFASGLHPLSRIEKIPSAKQKHLYENIQECLKEGILHCGVSVSDFVGTWGDLGKHQDYLKIYGRYGEKCYQCQSEVRRLKVAGRGTSVCEKCQKKV